MRKTVSARLLLPDAETLGKEVYRNEARAMSQVIQVGTDFIDHLDHSPSPLAYTHTPKLSLNKRKGVDVVCPDSQLLDSRTQLSLSWLSSQPVAEAASLATFARSFSFS